MRASGLARTILGDLVGEHIVVLPAAGAGEVGLWLSGRGCTPTMVLGSWHVALDGAGLAAFAAAFPALRYAVGPPTHHDLFPALAAGGTP